MPTKKLRDRDGEPSKDRSPAGTKPGIPRTTTTGRDGMRGPVPTKPGK